MSTSIARARSDTERTSGWSAGIRRVLLRTGMTGTVVTALCCLTPLGAALLAAAGLVAWLPYADYVLFPLMGLSMALVAAGLCCGRRRRGP